MTDRLVEKTKQYESLLATALEGASTSPADRKQSDLADDHLEMASAYLEDGRHFIEEDDYENALAAFSYGHGWLDAAIRSELVDPGETNNVGPGSV